ncbi:helix-turn-helix domain-containing protein [Algivirga pacifica]
MTASEKKKAMAERLFINDGESTQKIAEFMGVTERTIQRWVKEGDWQKRRELLLSAPHKIKEYLDKMILDSMKEDSDSGALAKKADAINKMVSAREKMGDKITANTVVSVFKEFNHFLIEIDNQFAAQLTKYEMQFVQHKAELEV